MRSLLHTLLITRIWILKFIILILVTGQASRQMTPENTRMPHDESPYSMHTSGITPVTSSPLNDVKSSLLHLDQHRSNDLLLPPPPPAPIAVPSSEVDRRGIDSTIDTTMLLPKYQSLTDMARLPAPEPMMPAGHDRSMFQASSSLSYPPSCSSLSFLEQNRSFPSLATNGSNYPPMVPSYFGSSVSPPSGTSLSTCPPYISGSSPTNSLTSPYLYTHLYGSPTLPQYNAGLHIYPSNPDGRQPDSRTEMESLRNIRSSPTDQHQQQHQHGIRDIKPMESSLDSRMMPTLTPAPNTSSIPVPVPVQNAAAQHDDSGPVWRPY